MTKFEDGPLKKIVKKDLKIIMIYGLYKVQTCGETKK